MTLFSIKADDTELYYPAGQGPLGPIFDSTFDDISNVTVTPVSSEATYRCKHCGAELTEYPGEKFTADDNGPWVDECLESLESENGDFGPHVPEFIPLSWVDSAEIDVDESQDMVTVSLMVNGSPIALQIHRVTEEGHENYGKLVIMAPYVEMSTELPLRQLQRGSLLVNFR